jgi:hypothetical protein
MAVGESVQQAIMEAKKNSADEDGVQDIQTRNVQVRKGRGPLLNLTDFGKRFHRLEHEEELRVVVHEDGIWIDRGN